MQHHKYNLSEIENMMPFERQDYVSLLTQNLEQVKQEQQKQKSQVEPLAIQILEVIKITQV